MVSPTSDYFVPHLSEKDARLLAEKVCERVFARGWSIQQIGVTLDHDGMWFVGRIHGKQVTARTGQGNVQYDDIAKDLILAYLDPLWNRPTLQRPDPVGLKALVRKGWQTVAS